MFDGATVEDVDHALVQWQKGHTGAIRMDIDEKRRPGEKASGKFTLFNGRTGEPFEKQVTVGYMYILKLQPPRRRQDPRAQHGPVLARHAAAAGWQGAVRRSALR